MHHSENAIEEDVLYSVIVTKLLTRGIIVQVGETGNTEFIHISRISKQFVSNITDFVSVGTCLTTKGVSGKDGKIELSLIHLNLSKNGGQTDLPNESDKTCSCKNLDDMIAVAELSMHDKIGKLPSKAERKRRRRNNRRNYD